MEVIMSKEDNDPVNGWWYDMPQYLPNKKPKIGFISPPKRNPITNVKVCPNCDKGWQRLNKSAFEYLADFPTYGLTRKICPKCNKA